LLLKNEFQDTNFTIELYPNDHVHTWGNGILWKVIYHHQYLHPLSRIECEALKDLSDEDNNLNMFVIWSNNELAINLVSHEMLMFWRYLQDAK